MDANNIPTTLFDAREIKSLKEIISQKWVVFEANLIKAIESVTLSDWSILDPSWIIKRYADMIQNAEMPNPRTGEMIPDNKMRLAALDKLTKIMLWQSGSSKWTTINIQNNTNTLWNQSIPVPWAKLIF